MENVTLNNGVKMPVIGFGTFQTPPALTEASVARALKTGYRSIDTAQVYGNEAGVGAAIKNSGLARNDLFITTKTQTDGYNETAKGIDESLRKLQLDYVDLMIIHWPTQNSLETYRALSDAYKEGKIKAIGLSNFNPTQIQAILDSNDVKPTIDQIETHLYWQQNKIAPFLTENEIVHEAWAPLGEQYAKEMMQQPEIVELAQKYNVSGAQILLRAMTQQKIVVIPKSNNEAHLQSNLDIFGFKLTDEELESLKKFDQHHSIKDWPVSMRESVY
ncbi:aldo/keto reductase [Companilactobacillus nantensis]|uniref:Aldo keto reductase n=1 Tax=Companilactobacillus nantensis DSM 16982 TaxID=1423774 RepID=A0A0R1WIS6_9LACO|nr:aldo/keto reductase [Companilactobacillus nantensis]KRM17647.1 aldo keto reductase [Companilactobacillus nantensis DSM 16982]GEO63421.1 oxidoreductase [Companilactobacillus nantensis]